jgi:hypothetical protein
MQKRFATILTLIMVLALALGISPRNVQASAAAANSEWNTGTLVAIDLTVNPVPEPWLQLFGSGVKIDAPATLCHAFRSGGYGWTPVIYQLTDNGWMALATTNERASDETEYQACAAAYTAGTYALFASYKQPTEVGCKYDTSDWDLGTFDASHYPDLYPDTYGRYLTAYLDNLPIGTKVIFTLIEGYEGLEMNPSGSGFVYYYEPEDGRYADFMTAEIFATTSHTAKFRITAAGCSKIFEVKIPVTEF